jgi:hypothetical protein
MITYTHTQLKDYPAASDNLWNNKLNTCLKVAQYYHSREQLLNRKKSH